MGFGRFSYISKVGVEQILAGARMDLLPMTGKLVIGGLWKP